MAMNIQNTTTYNKDLIIAYNQSYFKTMFYRRTIPFAVVVAVIALLFFVIQEYISAIAVLVIFFFYMIIMMLMEKVTLKKVLHASPIVEEPFLQRYLFTDYKIEIEGRRPMVIPYEDIRSIHLYGVYLVIQTKNRYKANIDTTQFDKSED